MSATRSNYTGESHYGASQPQADTRCTKSAANRFRPVPEIEE